MPPDRDRETGRGRMNVNNLLQALIWGLSNGAVFALIALGYTLVYGIIELINFAHGDVFMIGSFVGLTCLLQFAFTRNDRGRLVQSVSGPGLALLLLAVLLA